MQLPRGTFRSIKKGIRLSEIMDDLIAARFTGICTFSSGAIKGTLVFKGGACVLAKVQDQYGDRGLDEARALADQVSDAVLSDLDTTQLQLALEFNKNAHVRSTGGHAMPAAQKAGAMRHLPEQKTADAGKQHEEKDKGFIKTPQDATFAQVQPVPQEKKPVPVSPGLEPPRSTQEPAITTEPENPPSDKEYDSIDSMNYDDVSQKIRKDVKIILKQLELDHLTKK